MDYNYAYNFIIYEFVFNLISYNACLWMKLTKWTGWIWSGRITSIVLLNIKITLDNDNTTGVVDMGQIGDYNLSCIYYIYNVFDIHLEIMISLHAQN
jgi:hypothetical protein